MGIAAAGPRSAPRTPGTIRALRGRSAGWGYRSVSAGGYARAAPGDSTSRSGRAGR